MLIGTLRVLATLAFLATPAWLEAQPPSSLSGRVLADASAQPVSGADVTLASTSYRTATDDNGAFSFPSVPVGRYTIVVTKAGFEAVSTPIDVTAAGARLDVRLPAQLDVHEEVLVVGRTVGDLGLTNASATASRLGIPAIDVPASVEVLDNAVMNARGYQKLVDAVGRMAGVVAGEHPTAPSSFTMRGFTASQVALLRDGIWLGPSTMVGRPQNIFNLQRVELLRGPASVVNGQGAVAGAVNSVTKTAEPTRATSWNALLSYGRFNTTNLALGVGGPVNQSLWYRVDVSRSSTDGYVTNMGGGSTNLTASLLWRPVSRLQAKISFDYLDDDIGQYFGTPLVPRSDAREPLDVIRGATNETIDGRTRFVNYNISDGVARADQTLLRADVTFDLADRITLTNVAYGYDADRRWMNAEGYVYCTRVVDVCRAEGQVQRYYGYFVINHDHRLYGDRLMLNVNRTLAGRPNHAVAGVEASTFDFSRTRGFRRRVPVAAGDSVDLLNPTPGLYGPIELRATSPTDIGQWAVFTEDSLALTSRVRVSGGLRFDGLDLDRRNLSPEGVPEAGGFTRSFTWWSWRAGSVVTMAPGLVGYAQYSNAKDPVSANLFLVNAGQNFDLTEARQFEAGVKADLRNGRAQLTAAYFDIERDDVLDRFALDSVTNIGGVDSSGVELAASLQPNDHARIGGNVAYTDSSFRPSPNFQRFSGNRAPNVPAMTANLWASYQRLGSLPIEIGGSVRYVGERFTNNANTSAMRPYTVTDVYAAWTRDRVRVTARLDNVADTVYASWADPFYIHQVDPSFLYANQLLLGPPRAFSLMLQVGF